MIGTIDRPAIPGLVVRNYRDETDLPFIVDVYNACFAADRIEDMYTIENQASRYRAVNHFDPQKDVFVIEVDQRVVATGRLFLRVEDDGCHVFVHFGGVRPEWRGHGLGRTLLRMAEQRMRAIASQSNGEPFFARTFVADTQPEAEALLRDESYSPVRYHFNMLRSLADEVPDVPSPDGLDVRSVQPDQLRAIWEAKEEAFRDHWGSFAATEWHYQNWLNDPDRDVTLWRVAWDGDQVAGMVLGSIHAAENEHLRRKRGWLECVAVRRPWRKRGLARALMMQTMQALKARGMAVAVLDVDADNLTGALRLYENIGFHTIKRWTTYQKQIK